MLKKFKPNLLTKCITGYDLNSKNKSSTISAFPNVSNYNDNKKYSLLSDNDIEAPQKEKEKEKRS